MSVLLFYGHCLVSESSRWAPKSWGCCFEVGTVKRSSRRAWCSQLVALSLDSEKPNLSISSSRPKVGMEENCSLIFSGSLKNFRNRDKVFFSVALLVGASLLCPSSCSTVCGCTVGLLESWVSSSIFLALWSDWDNLVWLSEKSLSEVTSAEQS